MDLVLKLISMLKDLIIADLAIVTAVVAVFGLTTWRRQLAGESRHRIAYRVMSRAILLRNTILELRRESFPTYIRTEDKTPVDIASHQIMDRHVAYLSRLSRLHAAVAKLEAAELQASVLFGDVAVEGILRALFNCATRLEDAVPEYYALNRFA
ncbi:MAG: hypothetical protein HZC42_02535 [Candidatus Eisenbacteria bacterium]|nr:hypothetical protein [Candidatus Eisenbacteria bacterium]